MFPIKIAPQDPFCLILVNDSYLLKEKISFDNTWEIQYEGGELGGISLYSTLGLQASSLRITPIFSNLNESRINLKQFKHPPNITEVLPNYTNISVEVFTGVHYQLKYLVSSSTAIIGQVSITNSTSTLFKGELQYNVSLNPFSNGEQMKGTQSDSNYFLEGKTKDLFPIFSLSGHAQMGKMGQSSINCSFEVEPGATQHINWCLAFEENRTKSLEKIYKYQGSGFEKEATRNKLNLQREYFFFETGNPDWDRALLASQNSAMQLMIGSTEEKQKISLIESRHPEKSLFKPDLHKHHLNEGVSPLQLWYFIQVLPRQNHFVKTVFDEFLDAKRDDGFIPNHSNPSNFLARFHAFPMLANIAKEILEFQGTSDIARLYLEKLIPYLQYWLNNPPEDASPHWENTLQSLYEDFPILNLWDKNGFGINARWIESPFLNSLLALECEKCLQIADLFEIIIPERAWLEDQKRNLLKNIENSWNSNQKYFAYCDIQTKKTPGKTIILKSNKTGLIQLEKKLRSAQRLNIRVVTPPELSRKISIEIKGSHENNELIETIMPRDFTWSTTTGFSTTENVFDHIISINILGLKENSLIEVTTSQYSTVDLSMFLPLLIPDINKKRNKQMINQWLEKEFLCDFGFPLVTRKIQGKRSSHLNWVDIPLNTLLLEGLIEQQELELAKNLFNNLMKAVIKNLRLSKKFFKRYNAYDGTCTGEYNIINGMIPLKIFLRLLGIQRWTDHEIEFNGSNVFKNEIKLFYRGLKLICSQNSYTIITPGGKIIELKARIYQKVKIPT